MTLGVKGVMVCEWSDLGKGVNKTIDWSNAVSRIGSKFLDPTNVLEL